MVPITALWLPILVSAVLVFAWSSVVHMVLGYHRGDYAKLPNEDAVMEALRNAGVAPGNYHFPHVASPKEMSSPAFVEKRTKGPVGLLNVIPSGPPALGKSLAMWFAFSVVVGVFVAYLTGRAFGPDTPYLTVFRSAGTIAFVAYAATHATDPIWKGERWGTALKHVLDGLVYGLLTAGAFGWLWPRG
jgi:hypothetical protein